MQEYLNDTSIETGVIIDVDVRRYTADVGTQHTSRQLFGIPWSSPYLHIENGEGINYFPEVGAPCLVCIPSDGEDNAFIIGYLPTSSGDSYKTNRISMNPGDIALNTRDGNHVILRRGGAVQIGSTAIAQRLYLPLGNAIKDFAQNYHMTTPGGEMYWELATDEKSEGATPTRYVLKVKEIAEQERGGEEYPSIIAVLGTSLRKKDPDKRNGQHNLSHSNIDEPGNPVVELDITLPSISTSSFNIAIDGGGNMTLLTQGDVEFVTCKKLYVTSRGRNTNIEGNDKLEVSVKREEIYKDHSMEYTTSVEKGTTKKIDARVMLGDMNGQGPALRDAAKFITALEAAFVTVKGDKVQFLPGTKQLLQQLYVSSKVTIG